jgi:hypothetical protein
MARGKPKGGSAEAEAAEWSVGLVPLPVVLEGSPDANPTLVLAAVGPAVAFVHVLENAPSGSAGIADELARAVRGAAARLGRLPERVAVRDPALVEPLAAALSADGVREEAPLSLPGLDAAEREVLDALRGDEGEDGTPAPLPVPDRWAGWGLPPERVAGLFAAAAEFYRAAPWRGLTLPVAVHLPGGEHRVASLMGAAGLQAGLALFSSLADWRTFASPGGMEELMARGEGTILVLDFNARDEIPPPMRKEVAAAGWEVAGPRAYPLLFPLRTATGGVTAEDAALLATVLRAFARAGGALAGRLERGEEWADAETGVRLAPAEAPPETAALPWTPPRRLAPSGPEGPGAAPEAALRPLNEGEDERGALLDGYAAWLEGAGARTAQRHVMNAETWLDFLFGFAGVAPRAATEYDLRLYLYDWFPRKVRVPAAWARGLPASLRRFFTFLDETHGVRYPWAAAVLRDRAAFERRWEAFPGGHWWDPEVGLWQTDLLGDLAARALVHSPFLGDGEQWGGIMGPTQAMLEHELQRRWLLWRDEEVRAGHTGPDAVLQALARRQRAWETEPHPELGGATPLDAIRAERRERSAPPSAVPAKGRAGGARKGAGKKKPKGR